MSVFAPSISVGIGETYFVGWNFLIFDVVEGSRYDSKFHVNYTGIGVTEEQTVVIESIDRIPSQERLTFTDLTGQGSDAFVHRASCGNVGYHQRFPTYLWGSSDSSSSQVSVGNTGNCFPSQTVLVI